MAHRDHVVAVHLLSHEAGGNRFLCQRLRRRLAAERHRDRPLVVIHDKYDRQPPDAGHVHRLVDIALGGRPVSDHTNHAARLAAQPKRKGDTHRVCGLGAHRHTYREVFKNG